MSLLFRCGDTKALLDVWSATLDTPLFTVNAYDTKFTIASLRKEDIFAADPFSARLRVVVSLDDSREVREFASALRVALFEGPDALYWALHHAVCQTR